MQEITGNRKNMPYC